MESLTTTLVESPRERPVWRVILAGGLLGAILLGTPPARAADSSVPWECSGYSGEAQTRCLHAFIEIQREKIGKLEGELRAQQGTVGQLKEQVDRQSSATTDIQRQLSDRSYAAQSAPYPYPYSYPYAYAYPPAGLSLFFGRPWYGPSYFNRPFFYGPRFRYCRGPWRGCW
ncbi:MAG: hypothetical protein ACT4OO_06170 [Nitrospiraceae bacterium]